MTASGRGPPPDRYALILYGSETGNSLEVADRLGDMMERLRFQTIVTAMDDFADVVATRRKGGDVVGLLDPRPSAGRADDVLTAAA